ncbi:hypothetical protein Pmar_PMAR006817 [Perkinsus marinus ATCC 50983]|uniref:Uncharacterized protein n=1 Tax=Perkinsus marinus (strain ATCC 50983 / TXsc) TaxID=423536 RepID=C5K6K4_PERM5|nr:hypothetical protein Pmar_PMAR006817 [Perkinsus marinus ATCC 50983]EER19924.1 hypothetical protein Pmar_PMAR006817 [Perkinsus marinus ATCC 50983]|eukprot:XP_002788128.1 hypothetical protein Pmar_PMAR006817 [Perkinsus marinus ATCC 50983]
MHTFMNVPVLLVCLIAAWADATDNTRPEVFRPFLRAKYNDKINLTSATISEGGQYEKPKGKCAFDSNHQVVNCTCDTSNGLVDDKTHPGEIYAAVCGDDCQDTSHCPKPPTGMAQCGILRVCTIKCHSDKDCPAGAFCAKISFPYCTFRNT